MLQDFFAQLTTFVSGLEPWQQILALIPGRVSTVVDARLSCDKEATIKKVRLSFAFTHNASMH